MENEKENVFTHPTVIHNLRSKLTSSRKFEKLSLIYLNLLFKYTSSRLSRKEPSTWQLCKKESLIKQLKQRQMTTLVNFPKSNNRKW